MIALHPVEWPADPLGLELGRCQAGDLFELRRQVGNTAIVQLIGDLAKAHLIIGEQFLHLFDALEDRVLLDRDTLRL